MSARAKHVRSVLDGITLKNYRWLSTFRVTETDGVVTLQFASYRRDNTGDGAAWQKGRRFVIEQEDSDRAILRTALLAFLTFEEHELREQFTYKGQALYEPDHT